MEFSIYMNPQTRGPEEDVRLLEENIRQVVRVTEAGFAGVVLTEHHFSEYNTYGDNIFMAAHLVGLCPPGTKFLLSAVIPPLHDPMRLAQQLNLLDIVSKGNAIIGFGSGGSPVEFPGLGRAPKDRYEDNAQVLDAMKQAMLKDKSDPPLEWQTRYGSGTVYTRMMPTGYGRPMPLFAKAAITDEAAEQAGEDGLYLFTGKQSREPTLQRWEAYQAGLGRSGLSQEEIEDRLDWSFVQKQVIVAETDEEAREEAYRRMEALDAFNASLQAHVAHIKQAEQLQPLAANFHRKSREEFYDMSYITGTPETVRAELQRYADGGIRHMAMYLNFSFMAPEVADRSIELFIDEVLPHLRDPQSALVTGSDRSA